MFCKWFHLKNYALLEKIREFWIKKIQTVETKIKSRWKMMHFFILFIFIMKTNPNGFLKNVHSAGMQSTIKRIEWTRPYVYMHNTLLCDACWCMYLCLIIQIHWKQSYNCCKTSKSNVSCTIRRVKVYTSPLFNCTLIFSHSLQLNK